MEPKYPKRHDTKKITIIDPFLVIRNGDISELKSLIDSKRVNLHQTRWSGYTLLHRAAEIGHNELCRFLIDAGIQIDVRSTRGWYTPLHIAMGNGHIDTAHYLIDLGASPWKKSKYLEDPFEFAAKRGFVQISSEFKAKLVILEMQKSIQRHQMLTGESIGGHLGSKPSSPTNKQKQQEELDKQRKEQQQQQRKAYDRLLSSASSPPTSRATSPPQRSQQPSHQVSFHEDFPLPNDDDEGDTEDDDVK